MSAFEELTPPYSTIVVDPPWHYDEINPPNPRAPGHRERAGLPLSLAYSTMTLDEIKAMPVGDLGDDVRVYLWITQRYLFDGPSILSAWGFEPQSRVLVWCKPPMGTLNTTTEFVLMGKKGRPPRLPWHSTTWFDWPRKGGHSAKPDAFMDLVEQWSPGPYVELFCRRPRLGWDSWGYGYEIGDTA